MDAQNYLCLGDPTTSSSRCVCVGGYHADVGVDIATNGVWTDHALKQNEHIEPNSIY